MTITVFSLLAGFALLLGGGEYLIRGAAALALRFGLSHLVVGIVIVGFGTSVPELVAAVQAALAGAPGIAMGNVVGSNIANILLILGACVVIYPVIVSRSVIFRDGFAMVATAALLLLAVQTGELTSVAGVLFVVLLVCYLVFLLFTDKKSNGAAAREQAEELPRPSKALWVDLLMVAGGIAAVLIGGKLLVDGAIEVAKTFDVSDEVIGLTLVALGTSLPELATAVVAALRKHSDLALGNVLGSNVYNILGIGGITATISPIPVTEHMTQVDIPVMIGLSVLLFMLAVVVQRFGKRVGYSFLAVYVGYIYLLVA